MQTNVQDLLHTLIFNGNSQDGLLICGINSGWSIEDERNYNAGIHYWEGNYKSFFSDKNVQNFPFRNRIVSWFSLWGYELAQTEEQAGQFEKSIVQTNWLQSCSHDVKNIHVYSECINDSDDFLSICETLKPRIIFFFGKSLLPAFASKELEDKVQKIFGNKKHEYIRWLQKDGIYSADKPARRFKIGFQEYENLNVICFPHITGAQGISYSYIAAFKDQIKDIVDTWWVNHLEKLNALDVDPLYDEAAILVSKKGATSIAQIQRAFKIGYNRAATMIEDMKRLGLIESTYNGKGLYAIIKS